MEDNIAHKEPHLVKWGLKFAASAGIAGILCCVAPAVLFMMGLMGGVYAISFADFFYASDGGAGTGAWVLRVLALLIGVAGIILYRRKQNQCSVNSKQKQKNLVLLSLIVLVVGVSIFLSLEKLSSWYFDKYIVPAQQEELGSQF